MRERGLTFLLALGALVAFYGLWLRPAPSLDPDEGVARPTTAERRGDGLAAAYEWLGRSGVEVRSWRDRYTALADLNAPKRGNLLMLSLPGLDDFHADEFAALDAWVKRGNTLLISAALIDQPGWAVDRESATVANIEALTGIEFETREAREERLDDTPYAERVRRADALDAKNGKRKRRAVLESPDDVDAERDKRTRTMLLRPSGPHPLVDGVTTLAIESDYAAGEWSLRIPYDGFVLTLARTSVSSGEGEGVLFLARHGQGRIVLSSAGTLFTNRVLGQRDNSRLLANLVRQYVGAGGVVLFDDLRQGLSANYNPARFYKDPRLLRTAFIVFALWLIWVLGSTRLRAPVAVTQDPSEADLVGCTGGLIARVVAPHRTAIGLFDLFFAQVARAARGLAGLAGAERGELWAWLERHAAVLPQEMDQLKTWYADAHAERKVPLVPLTQLLDSLEKRLQP